ncbi:PH domain-containing protein DDB_G0274775-like [Halichondria panicea]|uniref:PH domain-containing protein DDB_G0274775-like n=1 Tax=Halichondria panicea TaxID=6063 RepID=UPI00312B5C40
MSLQTIKEGHLYKKGKINKDWRQRLFVLNGKRLSYFKGGNHSPAGTVELKDIRNVTDIVEDGTFQIKTPDRVYDIRGDTKEMSQEWVDAIKEAISA